MAGDVNIIAKRGDGFSNSVEDRARREVVKAIQKALKVDVDGQFGPNTERAVRDAQIRYGFTPTGKVDNRLYIRLLLGDPAFLGKVTLPSINDILVMIARSDLGQQEYPGNRGFKDPLFDRLMRGVGFYTGAPWCDFMAESWWKRGYEMYPNVVKALDGIFTGSTLRSFKNFKASGLFTVDHTPERGALAYYKHSPFTGHVVMITEAYTGSPRFHHIAGNTNAGGSREGIMVMEKDNGNVNDRKLLGIVHPIYT